MRSLNTILLGIGLIGASQSASAQVKVIKQTVVREDSTIAPRDLEAVAAHVGSLCVEPSRTVLHVGDTLSLDTAVVVAYDSLGKSLGRLRGFDSALLNRTHLAPTTDLTRRYVAITAGNAEMIFSYPRRKWLGRVDPPASAHFYISIVPD